MKVRVKSLEEIYNDPKFIISKIYDEESCRFTRGVFYFRNILLLNPSCIVNYPSDITLQYIVITSYSNNLVLCICPITNARFLILPDMLEEIV